MFFEFPVPQVPRMESVSVQWSLHYYIGSLYVTSLE